MFAFLEDNVVARETKVAMIILQITCPRTCHRDEVAGARRNPARPGLPLRATGLVLILPVLHDEIVCERVISYVNESR